MVKLTTNQQFEILLKELELYPPLARGMRASGENKAKIAEIWSGIGNKLNSYGPPIRTTDEWQRVWVHFKAKLKIKMSRNNKYTTFGEPSEEVRLTPLEQTAANLLQMKISMSPPSVSFSGELIDIAQQPQDTPQLNEIPQPNEIIEIDPLQVMEEMATQRHKRKIRVEEREYNFGEQQTEPQKNCKYVFDSRVNKFGRFETTQLFATNLNANQMTDTTYRCRYEFLGTPYERVQIKFSDFSIPTDGKNSSECKPTDSLQLLSQVRGKYESSEMYCGAFIPPPIMSKGPKLLLQFVGKYPPTTSKIHYYGFKAEFKFVTNFGIITGQQLGNNCTFIYNSTVKKSGWFGSPNFPGLYPQNMVCNYNFHGESGEKVVIRFTYFDVEGIGTCEYLTASDYVEFSNFMSTDRKYTKFCGKRDKFTMRSDGRFFRVTFYSNDRFDKTGFRAFYDFEAEHTPSENTSTQSYVSIAHTQSIKMLKFLLFCLLMLLYLNFKNHKIITQ